MKFLLENELTKRHRKHKKTIKPGAMGSFIHPDKGNQQALDTFNNSVDMGAVSNSGLGEGLTEAYDVDEEPNFDPRYPNVDLDKLWDIVDEYSTSIPISGNWDTERDHMLTRICDEFDISSLEAEQIAQEYLGWSEEQLDESLNENYSENDIDVIVDRLSSVYVQPDGQVTQKDYNKISSYLDKNYPEVKDEIIDRLITEYGLPSLTEDTVKQNGKWVNKGKEGTHGKFNTKKEAHAQRRAMFANGYHENLNEDIDYALTMKAYDEMYSVLKKAYLKLKKQSKPDPYSIGGTYYGRTELRSYIGNNLSFDEDKDTVTLIVGGVFDDALLSIDNSLSNIVEKYTGKRPNNGYYQVDGTICIDKYGTAFSRFVLYKPSFKYISEDTIKQNGRWVNKGLNEDLLTESKNDGIKKEFKTITGVDLLGKGVSTHHLSYDPEIVIFIDASAFGSYNTMNSDFVHHVIHFMNRTKVPVSISDMKKVKFYFYNRETKEYETDINFGRVLTLNNKYGLVFDDLKVQEA